MGESTPVYLDYMTLWRLLMKSWLLLKALPMRKEKDCSAF
jgi:hypothetical protein